MSKKIKFVNIDMQESARQKHMLMKSIIQEDKIAYGIENISLSFFLPDILNSPKNPWPWKYISDVPDFSSP